MEVSKAKNMIMHRGEIESRPPRVWFQVDSSKEDKKTSKKSRKSTKLKNEKVYYSEHILWNFFSFFVKFICFQLGPLNNVSVNESAIDVCSRE